MTILWDTIVSILLMRRPRRNREDKEFALGLLAGIQIRVVWIQNLFPKPWQNVASHVCFLWVLWFGPAKCLYGLTWHCQHFKIWRLHIKFQVFSFSRSMRRCGKRVKFSHGSNDLELNYSCLLLTRTMEPTRNFPFVTWIKC